MRWGVVIMEGSLKELVLWALKDRQGSDGQSVYSRSVESAVWDETAYGPPLPTP